MSPEDREFITRSITNLWAFNALFIAQLLYSLRKGGLPDAEIEALLQALDADVYLLDGSDDEAHAAEMLASIRARLAAP